MKNEQLQLLISELKKTSSESGSRIWKSVALDLERPTKKRAIVNLSKIDKYSENNDVVVVPGKILSMGTLTKKVTIAAFNFSGEAVAKIESSGSKIMSLKDLAKKNPKGSKIKIIG